MPGEAVPTRNAEASLAGAISATMSAVADAPRIADLEHRIAQDPSSIAFAQLAEEYRRAGRLADAIRLGRAGLAQYPIFSTARVSLARALLAHGLHDVLNELEAWLAAIRADRSTNASVTSGPENPARS